MGKTKILICDDIPEFLFLVSDILREKLELEFEIDLVSTAKAADILLRWVYYDIVIIDRVFPGMSGEFPAQIAKRRGMTVIGMTGYMPNNDRFNNSIDHLLMKPFNPVDLTGLIRQIINPGVNICGVCFTNQCDCD
jgi:DNA-binding response OmpR family regulator